MGDVWVYFIQGVDGGPIKIGRTKDPEKRLRDLQVASPVKLVIRRTFFTERDSDEKDLHSAFSVLRLHGEWFAPHPALARVADAIPDPSIPADEPLPHSTKEDYWAQCRSIKHKFTGEDQRQKRMWEKATSMPYRYPSILTQMLTVLPEDMDPEEEWSHSSGDVGLDSAA